MLSVCGPKRRRPRAFCTTCILENVNYYYCIWNVSRITNDLAGRVKRLEKTTRDDKQNGEKEY